MATSKIQTGLRIPEPLYERLKVIAESEGRSLNNLIEFVLQQYVHAADRSANRSADG